MNPVDPETPVALITNPDPKPGLKSTEFWLVAAANLVAVALVLLDKIEAEWAVSTMGILTALYTALRHRLKTTTAKEAGKSLFTGMLIVSLALGFMPGCATVTTRTTDPITGLVTEVTTKTPDAATVAAITQGVTAAAISSQQRQRGLVREEKAAHQDPRDLPITRDDIDRRFRPAAAK